ncbi:MAG: hypothetical protein JNL38_17925 [Myxococcales bacterium]|jgi:tetratricopeptide (TPR) repeat protein|nr:hypothetical protein [Myxococcales bacterium]
MRHARAALVVALVTCVGRLARAQEPAAEEDALSRARAAFFEGVAAEDRRDYGAAVAAYERARAITLSPQLLFNLASCRERLGELLRARDTFEEARALAEARGAAEIEAEARARRDGVAARVPRLLLRARASAAGAAIRVDGAPVEPGAGPVLLEPGTHRVVAEREGAGPFELTFDAAPGTERVVEIELLERRLVVVEERRPSPPSKQVNYTPAVALGGAAAVSGVVAVVTGALGYAGRDRYLELNGAPTAENRAEREELAARGNTLYVTSAIFTGVFVVAGAAAVYFTIAPPRRSNRAGEILPGWRFATR